MSPNRQASNAGFSIMDAMIGLAIFSIGLVVIMTEVHNQSALETKSAVTSDMIDMEDLFRAALTRRYADAVESNCATLKPLDLVQNVLPTPWTNTVLTASSAFKFNADAPSSLKKATDRCRNGSLVANGKVHLCALFERREPGLPALSVLVEAQLEPRDLASGTSMTCSAFLAKDARGVSGVYGMFVESRSSGTEYVYHESIGQILSGSRVK